MGQTSDYRTTVIGFHSGHMVVSPPCRLPIITRDWELFGPLWAHLRVLKPTLIIAAPMHYPIGNKLKVYCTHRIWSLSLLTSPTMIVMLIQQIQYLIWNNANSNQAKTSDFHWQPLYSSSNGWTQFGSITHHLFLQWTDLRIWVPSSAPLKPNLKGFDAYIQ